MLFSSRPIFKRNVVGLQFPLQAYKYSNLGMPELADPFLSHSVGAISLLFVHVLLLEFVQMFDSVCIQCCTAGMVLPKSL